MRSLRMRIRAASALIALAGVAPASAKKLDVPDGFPTVQAAVDAASPGDVIEVGKGVYAETVVVNTPNLTLRGFGAIIDAGYLGDCVRVTASGASVEGFELRNGVTGLFVAGDDAVIVDNEIRGAGSRGIDVEGDDALIERNEFRGCDGGCIFYESDSDTSVTRIERNETDGNDGSFIDARGGRLVIARNKARNVEEGIELEPSHPTLVSKVFQNELEHVDGDGIDVTSDGAGVVIEKNELKLMASSGIVVFGDHVSVRKNSTERCVDRGIEAFGASLEVVENKIRRVGQEGIECVSASGPTVILDNEVTGAGQDGILASGAGLTIAGNEVRKCFGDGIDLQVGENAVIEDNLCERNAHEGIDNSGLATRIESNICRKNGLDIAGTGNSGAGTVAAFAGNEFGTGGANVPQRHDYGDEVP